VGTVIPPTSPWMAYSVTKDDGSFWIYVQLTFTGTWASNTALTGGTVFRDPASPFTRIVCGPLNPATGQPTGAAKTFNVPSGTTVFNQAQINGQGFSTVADITGATQITAIP
jgi:hypothetical protein